MHKVIDDFYEPFDSTEAQKHERGQMWWICCPYLIPVPRVTRVLAGGRTREVTSSPPLKAGSIPRPQPSRT
jgi:hypothetical protein